MCRASPSLVSFDTFGMGTRHECNPKEPVKKVNSAANIIILLYITKKKQTFFNYIFFSDDKELCMVRICRDIDKASSLLGQWDNCVYDVYRGLTDNAYSAGITKGSRLTKGNRLKKARVRKAPRSALTNILTSTAFVPW